MIAMILAMDKNNLIGMDNNLPWHYSEDLKYFKSVTTGKAVFMGYNTYLSIVNRLGKPLPNRDNYVLTYEESLPLGGIVVKDYLNLIDDFKEKELFIIGGKSIYELTAPYVDYIYLTRINKEYEGNVYLNTIDFSQYELKSSKVSGDLSFEIYQKKQK